MPKIVSIHSYRGGTGKSNITANIAALIALTGRRVAMVDTDVQSPGIHVLFGLDESKLQWTLNDYLWERCNIEEAVYDVTANLRQANLHPRSRLSLVPASPKTSEIVHILREGYNVERLNQGFKGLIQKLGLDFLFIDTHPGLNEETLLSITVSDWLVLILRPDRQDFQGTAITIDVARRLEVPNMMLVVNKALINLDFERLRRQLQITYKVPVGGILPLSPEVVHMASGDIFALRYPRHAFSLEIRAIASQLLKG